MKDPHQILDTVVMLQARMPLGEKSIIKIEAARRGMTLGEYIIEASEYYSEHHDPLIKLDR